MSSGFRIGACAAAAGALALAGSYELSSGNSGRARAGCAKSFEHVVSVPIGRERQALLSVCGFGRLSIRCRDGAAVALAYRNTTGTSQSASVQAGGQGASSDLAPGERMLRPGPLAGVQLWQVATISKGRVAVARMTVSATRLGPMACFVSARSDALSRPR